jgi:hypothetical protein
MDIWEHTILNQGIRQKLRMLDLRFSWQCLWSVPPSVLCAMLCFRRMGRLHLQDWRVSQANDPPEASRASSLLAWFTLQPWRWRCMFLWNVSKLLPGYKTSHPIKQCPWRTTDISNVIQTKLETTLWPAKKEMELRFFQNVCTPTKLHSITVQHF